MVAGQRPWTAADLEAPLSASTAEDLRAAAGLEELADHVERRLEPVLDRLVPTTWSGRAAATAQRAAAEAEQDLRLAAVSLREVARELRTAAALRSWRAGRALVADDGPRTGVGR